MRREQRLTTPKQYSLVYRQGGSWHSGLLVMRAMPNDLDFSRFGLSVSKRVGKAVTRNKIKRRLREILRTIPVEPTSDIVFIARPAAASADYAGLKKTVETLLLQAGLIKETR